MIVATALLMLVVGLTARVAQGLAPPPIGSRYDAIIVAGCRVCKDGQPSASLQRRVDAAVEQHAAGRAPVVLFTGGPLGAKPTEAEAAARYAAGRGLPAAALLCEHSSGTTAENAQQAAMVLAAQGRPRARVLLVSDAYHTIRARLLFSQHFARVDVIGVRGPTTGQIKGALRELVALAAMQLRPHAAGARRRAAGRLP